MLSDLACAAELSTTRELLIRSVEADRLICPASPGALDETLDATTSWKAISDLQDELSMDISFLDDKTIAQQEVLDAAACFSGEGPLYSLAEEAFDRDPQTPRDELFQGGIRIRVDAATRLAAGTPADDPRGSRRSPDSFAQRYVVPLDQEPPTSRGPGGASCVARLPQPCPALPLVVLSGIAEGVPFSV